MNLIVRMHMFILATRCTLTARLASNDMLESYPRLNAQLLTAVHADAPIGPRDPGERRLVAKRRTCIGC
jgi:hypothetical protein